MSQSYIEAYNFGNEYQRGSFLYGLVIPAYSNLPALSSMVGSNIRSGLLYVNTSGNTLNYYSNGNWYVLTPGGGGSGTGSVTFVGTGTGLTGGPITSGGTISLANTSVTPGSYTNLNATIDAQGRITAASNGSASMGTSGTVTSIQFNSPLTGGTITTSGTVGIQQATSGQSGALSAFDWQFFYNKQSALYGLGLVRVTSGTVSYDNSTYLTSAVTSVSGTPNRITSTGGANPVIDISSLYSGQTSIVTIGALTSGSVPYSLITGTPSSLPPSGNAGGDLSGTYPNPTVGLNKITYSKLQQESSFTLLGNATSGTSNVSEIQLGSGLLFSGSTLTAIGAVSSVSNVDGTLTISPTTGNVVASLNTGHQNSWTAGQAGKPFTLTYGSTLSPSFANGNNFQVQLTGNATLGNPVNTQAGQSGVIGIYQDGTGSRTLTYGWMWSFNGGVPPLTSTSYALDRLIYQVDYYYSNTATITNASPAVITTGTHGLLNGQQVQFTTTGTLPTGISTGVTYYVNVLSSTTFNVATSLTNLNAGTYVNTSSAGSGTHTASAGSIYAYITNPNAPVNSVSGTTNRITVTGTSNPTVDISSLYSGQTSISVIGTLTSGSIPYSLVTGTPGSLPPSGAAGGDLTGTYPNPILISTGVTSGTYGSSIAIPSFIVDSKGRLTSATTVPVIAPAGTLTGSTLSSGVTNSSLASVGILTSGTWNATPLTSGYIGNNAVTYGKLQNASTTSRLLGSSSSSTGIQELSVGAGLQLSGTTLSVLGSSTTSGTVTNVSGTTNRIVVTSGTTTPVIDIAANYSGQTSIVTLGIVTSGTWQSNKIGLAYGGTNSDLSGTGGTGQYLKQSATGAAITVGTIPSTDITGLTSGTVTNFNAGSLSPLFSTLVTSATTTPVLSFLLTSAAPHTFFGNFTSGTVPSYSSPILASADFANQGTATTVLHGNASGNPSWSQIATPDIANNAVTYAKLQSGSTASVLLGTPSTGQTYQEITLGSGLILSGSTLSSNAGSGNVNSVNVVTANGLAGTSSGTTNVNLTLSTTATGILKGNGTAIQAATPGTDYITSGANSTLTSLTGITGNITSPLSITFSGVSGAVYSQGKLVYDTDNDSLTFFNSDSNVSLQVGQEEWVRVKNSTGSSIINGTPVYVNGADATSGLPTIGLAKADSLSTSQSLGLTTETITNGSIGYVTSFGEVHNLNTSGFTVGATIYISAVTAGVLTSTAPSSPNYIYRIGTVTKSDPTSGIILVTPSTALSNTTSGTTYTGVAPIVTSGSNISFQSLPASSIPLTLLTSGSPASSLVYTSSGIPSTIMSRDTNANTSINNITQTWNTIVTSGTTTTLTVSSAYEQNFTGTNNQTVTLPVVATLTVGFAFLITNQSTGALTINSSGGNLVQTVSGASGSVGSTCIVKCIATTGTTAASWEVQYAPAVLPSANGGTGISSYVKGQILYATSGNTLALLNQSTSGTVLGATSGTPQYITPQSFLTQQFTNSGSFIVNIPPNQALRGVFIAPATGSQTIRIGTTSGGTDVVASTSYSSVIAATNSASVFRYFSTSGNVPLYVQGHNATTNFIFTVF